MSSSTSAPFSLRVAAIQPRSVNGDPEGNLRRAQLLIAEAATGGAQLVLLPELVRAGYDLTRQLWKFAEPTAASPSVRFATDVAKLHGIYVGLTFLEASGDQFYNTFVLAGAGSRPSAAFPVSEGARSEHWWSVPSEPGASSARVASILLCPPPHPRPPGPRRVRLPQERPRLL